MRYDEDEEAQKISKKRTGQRWGSKTLLSKLSDLPYLWSFAVGGLHTNGSAPGNPTSPESEMARDKNRSASPTRNAGDLRAVGSVRGGESQM